MNYLVTGFPGTGKSAIAIELKRRGHIAYDPQAMRTLMHVEDRISGRRIHPPKDVPAGWYDTEGAYNWNSIKIQELLSTTDDIYICSKSHNQETFYKQFDKIFLLTLDFTLLLERLRSRSANSIGKTPAELSDILINRAHFEQSLSNYGAITINVAKPVSRVVDTILELTY